MRYIPAIFALFLFSSCYYDNEEKLTEGIPCFTDTISYRNNVVPVLEANCYSCHSLAEAQVSGDGIVLEGYASLISYLQDNTQTFIGSVDHNGDGSPMPDDASKMDRCSRQTLTGWIEQGKKDN